MHVLILPVCSHIHACVLKIYISRKNLEIMPSKKNAKSIVNVESFLFDILESSEESKVIVSVLIYSANQIKRCSQGQQREG